MGGILRCLESVADTLSEDAVAISSGNRELSYPSFLVEVKKCAQWLLSIRARVVALRAENSIDWVLLDLACQELGLVFIPLPAFFTEDQIQHCLSLAAVDTLLDDCRDLQQFVPADASCADPLEKTVLESFHAWRVTCGERRSYPDGTQKITFTSGSTGHPKGVCLSLEHQWQVARSLADATDINQPIHLCLLPLSTLLENIAGVYSPLLCGGTVVVPKDAERGMLGSSRLDCRALLCCIDKSQPTTMILVPQLLALLVRACETGWAPPGTLQFVAVGGGKVSPRLIHRARELALPVFQGYGLSECGSVVALNVLSEDDTESTGHVLPHCCVSIENDEVVVSGDLFLGYLGEPASWYPEKVYTGDIGHINHGRLRIDGRIKNVLITSFGRNICPEWVESVLMSIPLLSRCFVVGDAKPRLCALLSAPCQVSDADIEAWVGSANQMLPDYAQLAGWIRLEESDFSPFTTANGRPQREKMIAALAESIDQLYLNLKVNAAAPTNPRSNHELLREG